MSFPIARKRSGLIGFVIAALVVAMSSLAGAHGGDTTQIHGCVAAGSGYLRIIDENESCNKGEIALDWKIDSGTELNALKEELKNSGGVDTAVNETTDPVSWWKLKDLPSELADGRDAVDGGVAHDVACPTGCVSTSEIEAQTITRDKLRSTGPDETGGAVTTDRIDKEAITTSKIAPFAVTTSKLDGSDELDPTALGRPRAVTAAVIADGAVISRTISEGAITASKLAPGAVTNAAIADGAISIAKLDTDVATQDELNTFVATLGSQAVSAATTNGSKAPNSTDALVEWSRLKGVPAGFADNDDDIDGGTAADLACAPAGCVDASDLAAGAVVGRALGSSSIAAGSITGEAVPTAGAIGDIALGTIGGPNIAADTITAANLGTNSVGSDEIATGAVGAAEIADGSITSVDLLDGAVTTDKQTANASSGAGGTSSLSVGTPTNVASALLNLSGGAHKVLVTGQAQISCAGCTVAGDSVSVTWRIVDLTASSAVVVGGVYNVTLTTAMRTAVLPVSGLAITSDTGATPHSYHLEVTATSTAGGGSATVTNAVIAAVDLGR